MPRSKEAELAAIISSPPEDVPKDTQISISPGLARWMLTNRTSLAFTSYQTGQLILAGVGPDGRVSFNEQDYARATGLCYNDRRLYVGSMFQVWRLENMLKPGQYANKAYDCMLVPRAAQTTNYVDVHEMEVDKAGRLIFVNTRYSCLATFDETHSFRPVWKPDFISGLAPEDRCHLNGLAMEDGEPRYVTAVAATDVKDGWRPHRSTGGVLIDVRTGRIVTEQLSMPHSPRLHEGRLWALDSGRGQLVTVDEANGRTERVAFCPGFLRGLAFHNGFAVVTVSKAREGSFRELDLQQEIEKRGAVPLCGVLMIDLGTGEIQESILFEGKVAEMFDVALLPMIRNPASIGPRTTDMIGSVSLNDEFAPL